MTKQPAEIAADTSPPLLDMTMFGLLEWAAEHAPDRTAIKQPAWADLPERSWSYADLLADACRMAAYLGQYVSRGDHLAILAPNLAHWYLYQFAAAQLGVVLVALNPAMRAGELEYTLAKSNAKALVTERSFRGTDLIATIAAIRPKLPALEHVFPLDEWQRHLDAAPGPPPPSPTRGEDPAMILFTSGTTGKPKATLLHQAACVNVARIGAERGGLPEGSVWLGTLPVFHSGGPITICLAAISRLNTLIVMPPFEPGLALALIARERINWAPLVPAMLIPMIEHPDFATTDISSLKALLFGGTTLTPSFLEMARERMGAEVQTVFGMTEAAGEILKTDLGDPIDVVSQTVGTPLPHVDLRIVDPVGEAIVASGEVGEIRYRSPFMTSGYYGDDAATQRLFDDDGFLRTGDLGVVDAEGRVRITGRLKEMIIRKGENIYPREIEDMLAAYPGVAEAAVIGLPHDVFGEEVAVAVRAAAGTTLEIAAMRAYLNERVARYKVPQYWQIVDDFPRSAFGKIQKFQMPAMFAEPS